MQQLHQLTGSSIAFQRMPERLARMNSILVTPSYSLDREVSGLDKIGHNLLHRSLGNSHLIRDIAETGIVISANAQQHMRMIREERPRSL